MGIGIYIPDKGLAAERLRQVAGHVGAILDGGNPVMIEVHEYRRRGTLEQNRMFHVLCSHIAEEWGKLHPDKPTSPERVKTSLKSTYGVITTEYCPLTDKRKPRLVSWSDYTKKQRMDLITATLAWMADHGIPDQPELNVDYYNAYRDVG